MDSPNNKNTILAIVLSLIVLLGWQFFYVAPKLEAERKAAEIEAQRAAEQAETVQPGASGTGAGDIPQPQNPQVQSQDGSIPGTGGQGETLTANRDAAIAASRRVTFENTHIKGSINLQAARIDDLLLKDHHVKLDKTSPLVTLLTPSKMEDGYFAEFGYVASANSGKVPGPETVWNVSGNDQLTPASPVTLEWTNEKGLKFVRTIKMDDEFLFTYEDQVTNNSGEAIALSPYGRVTRFGTPFTENIFVLHEGLIGYFGEDGLQEVDYSEIEESREITGATAAGYNEGWLGITDKYWAAAIIPDKHYTPRFAYFDQGRKRYQADYLADQISIAPGASTTTSQRVFAGAKKVHTVDNYQDAHDISGFDKIIDWGWFYFITKPLAELMTWLNSVIGNFGIAILVTTVIIKALLFYFANLSYASMAKMKKVQPEMLKIKERYGDDRVKQQQEMMALYKKEKINPAAGCWPMLIQIPVFFALYKVIYVTIEMRHAPFFGWIQDLSAPDPTSIFNLFGLLPFEVPALLMIGIWPIIMGITMFLQMQMNPAPPDPTQAMIFKWMPIVFTFMLATFPAGLVIYWAWNNFLSIIQQGVIMRRHGVKIELWDNLKTMFKRKPAADSSSK